MSHALVTGGAGFIGAAVVARLLAAETGVTVIDPCPTPRQRAAAAGWPAAVRLVQADLHDVDLVEVMAGCDRVIHLAGTPGVQSSWADGFDDHLRGNLATTQRVLEAALVARPSRLVLASSSSVLGEVAGVAAAEDAPVAPRSPYGATKAAMELLAGAYATRGLPVTMLRYFTVVGRGQRPDMAVHRMIDAARGGPPFPLRGDGTQVRDFTAVDDVARATVAAADTDLPTPAVLHVGGGDPVDLRTVLRLVEEVVGAPVPVRPVPAVPGDPQRTASDCRRADQLLGWSPRWTLRQAIADQAAHQHAEAVVRAAA